MRSSPPLRVLVALVAALLLPLVAAAAPAAATVVSRLTAVAPGGGETCGVTVESSVKCWGYGRFGGLGTGTRATSLIPVDVAGLADGVTSVESGSERSCAISREGEVKCWGLNATLERGPPRSPPPYSLTPVAITGLGSVTAVAIGAAIRARSLSRVASSVGATTAVASSAAARMPIPPVPWTSSA